MPKPTSPRPRKDQIVWQDSEHKLDSRSASWELREKLIAFGMKHDSDLGLGHERFMELARVHGLA